jgi:hypothetical protein
LNGYILKKPEDKNGCKHFVPFVPGENIESNGGGMGVPLRGESASRYRKQGRESAVSPFPIAGDPAITVTGVPLFVGGVDR